MIELSPYVHIEPRYLNRHGAVIGATGSGKTMTLLRIAEQAAAAGVNVVATDLKGDFRRIVSPDALVPTLSVPLGRDGVRVPLSDLGPDGFARMIEANAVQLDAVHEVFSLETRFAKFQTVEHFLRALSYCEAASTIPKSVSAALRRRCVGVQRSADIFGTESRAWRTGPCLNVLDCVDLADLEPRGYGVLMAHLLRRETLAPEVGDLTIPRRLYLIDEAHLLFSGATESIVRDILRTIRLVRSKGVGVWFATQSPQDLPPALLDQLGSRIVHAMRPGPALNRADDFLPAVTSGPRRDIAGLRVGEAYAAVPGEQGELKRARRVQVSPPVSPLVDKPVSSSPIVDAFRSVYGHPPYFKTSGFREEEPTRRVLGMSPVLGAPYGPRPTSIDPMCARMGEARNTDLSHLFEDSTTAHKVESTNKRRSWAERIWPFGSSSK